MNSLLVRFVFWFVTLALFPVPLPLYGQSFQVEVLQRITLAALPPRSTEERPGVAATWQVLHCHPDEVWPRILEQRRAKLGSLHDKVWGAASSPRKPARSVTLEEFRRRTKSSNSAA